MLYPLHLIETYPLDTHDRSFITQTRQTVSDIISGKDKRLLVIVGPHTIHDPKSAREYAERLIKLRDELAERLFIIMRVYFDKPPAINGWQGLINDPDIDESFQFEKGLCLARHLLLDLCKWRLPTAAQYLDLLTPQYFADLIAWAAVGAATVESQTHRELASGLSCPVGFENSTDGNVDIAIDAIVSAAHSHMFWGIDKKGRAARYQTAGNVNCHVILRGGPQMAGDAADVAIIAEKLHKAQLTPRLMVNLNCSHSKQSVNRQGQVMAKRIVLQFKQSAHRMLGVMIDSHLVAGRQDADKLSNLTYGQSITHSCVGWLDTEHILRQLYGSLT